MGDIQSVPQSVHICLNVEYISGYVHATSRTCLHLSVSAVSSSQHNLLWLIDIRLNWLAVVSAPLTSARVAAEDYNTDCISIFNGKCQNIQSSFLWVHAECFAPLATLRKTNWLHYQLPNVHLLFVIIKWHVFVLSWNWLCRAAHRSWRMMLFCNLISHLSLYGSY